MQQHVAAAGHVLGTDIRHEENRREQSLLGNSIVLESLGLKEYNVLGVRIVLVKDRSLRIMGGGRSVQGCTNVHPLFLAKACIFVSNSHVEP
jgi:hypothetical protein